MRGLLAIEPLYHQIVAGYKTQTRRSGGLELVNDTNIQMNGHVRSPNDWLIDEVDVGGPIPWVSWSGVNSGDCKPILSVTFRAKAGDGYTTIQPVCKPRYKVGEVLYLKEPLLVNMHLGPKYYYDIENGNGRRDEFLKNHGVTKTNKLFMPASAARAFVRITGIKCERLKDITESDALAEGVELVFFNENKFLGYKDYRTNIVQKKNRTSVWRDARGSFYSLYMFANKKPYTGDAGLMPNPWLWVYTFEYLPNYQITK